MLYPVANLVAMTVSLGGILSLVCMGGPGLTWQRHVFLLSVDLESLNPHVVGYLSLGTAVHFLHTSFYLWLI